MVLIALIEKDVLLKELENLGFSSIEAKVYVSLLKQGVSSANQISKKIGINRTQSYVVVKELVEKGIVIQHLGRPLLFESISPNAMLQIIMKKKQLDLSELNKKGVSLLKQLEEITPLKNEQYPKPEAQKNQKFQMISGNLCTDKLVSIIDSSNEEILLFIRDNVFQQSLGFGIEKALVKAASNKIKIRINLELNSQIKEIISIIKNLTSYGTNVNFKHSLVSYDYVIIDKEVALLGITYSKNKNCLIARNKEFISNLKNSFDERWQIAQSIEERIAELDAHVSDEDHKHYQSFVQQFQGIAYRTDINVNLIFLYGISKEISGYTNEELLSKIVVWDRDIMHPDDQINNAVEYEKMKSIPNYCSETEYRIITKDKRIRWVHESWKNICDENNKPKYIQGYIYDVTERKQNEEIKKHSDWILNTIYENMPIVTYSCNNDDNLTIIQANETIKDLTGYSSSEWITNKISRKEILHPDDRAHYMSSIKQALTDGKPFFINNFRIIDRNNKIRFLKEKGRGIYDKEGKIIRIDGIFLESKTID